MSLKVSAIVSLYKAGKFVKGCLEDLVNQTLYKKGELEIVIINSNSPENEEEIIKEYIDKYENIIYEKAEEREGIYAAWNRGIKLSSGKYLTNANADDRHHPEALEKMANILDEKKDIDLVYYDLKVTKKENETFDDCTLEWNIIRPDFSKEIMMEGCHMGPQPMWRRSVHENIGYFNDAFDSAGDYEFWMRMVFVNNSKLFHLKEILGLYLYNENGIELSNVRKSQLETGIIKDIYIKYLKLKEIFLRRQVPVDIVFLTHNRLAYFHETLNSLFKNTKYPFNIIVVDNNSDAETVKYLKQYSILFKNVIFNNENEWTSAFHKGIKYTESDPFIVSDPDILVPEFTDKCWLERVLELHRKYDNLGLLALNLDSSNKPKKLPDVYIGEKKVLNEDLTLCNVGTVMQSIKRKYYNFEYKTDWETCESIRKNGGLVGFARNIVAYHLGWNEEKDYPEYMIEKYKYFKDNYNVDTYTLYTEEKDILEKMNSKVKTSYYRFSRPEIQKLVDNSPKRILDVGCGEGVMAYELKKKHNAEVWGIEIFDKAAKVASLKLDKVINASIEDALNELPDNYFDTIIFADVLEHLVDPYTILSRIKRKLTEKGEIVASIPNIQHWTIILDLIKGLWDYQDEGLLDKTHLRFFTFKSINELFTNQGYEIKKIEGTRLTSYNFPESFKSFLTEINVNENSFNKLTDVYQFLIKAIPAKSIRTSIIIPSYNNLEYLEQTISSLFKFTENFDLIIVDNNSTNDVINYLKELKNQYSNVQIIFNKENKGFPCAVNQGLKLAKSNYVVIANNDIVFTPNWLTRLLEVAESKPEIGIVGPLSNFVSGVQLDKNAQYQSIEEMLNYAECIKNKNNKEILEFPRIAFLCALIKKEVIEKIGGLDERFNPGNFEDDDFCLRAQIAGYKTIIAKDVFIHHYGSKSFLNKGTEAYNLLLQANKEKFVAKWSADPDQIWLQGADIKRINPVMPLNENEIVEAFERAQVMIENEDYPEAKRYLEECLKLIQLKKNVNIDQNKIEELLQKLNKIV